MGGIALTGTRRLLEVPIQPSLDAGLMARLSPIQPVETATLLCSAGAFTSVATFAAATGFAMVPITGMWSQMRRPEPPATIALLCPNPATIIGLEAIGLAMLIPTRRAVLVSTGALLLLIGDFAVAVIACDDEGWFFEPGPVTEVRVSTAMLPV